MNSEKIGPVETARKRGPANAYIRTEGVRYSYRKEPPDWKLNGIDLAVHPDEYLLIAGASGSGKSTLCRTFNGLIPHFYGGLLEGRISVGGRNTAEMTVGDLFSQVGMVFQNPEAQLFNRTVEQEIAFGLESLGISRVEMKRRVQDIVRTMGIERLLKRDPHSISGGEQQLVILAAILCLKPNVIVLDEPYANLDPAHVGRVRKALRKIHRQGIGIIIAEHRMNHTAPDADRMIVMREGGMVEDGDPGSLLRSDAADEFGLIRDFEPIGTRHPDSPPFRISGSAPSSPILEMEDVAFYAAGRKILDRIRFDIRQGESIALIGANGAGKTTLLKHFNGLLRPAKGRIRLHGEDIRSRKVSQLARHVGLAFQNPASQFFKLTVRDEILAGPLALHCLDEKWIDEIIRIFRLAPLLDRAPFRLSGGEKKRVAFAAALAARPEILALDEPTAGQDGHFRKQLRNFLMEIRSQGRAVVFATHDLNFAANNSARWLVMHQGRIIRDDSPENITADSNFMEKAGLAPASRDAENA